MAEREKFRVAIAVFVEVEGVDALDASSAAQMLIRKALQGDQWPTGQPFVLHHERPDGVSWDGEVVNVMDVGMAAGNGYLWIEPTAKSWREKGL